MRLLILTRYGRLGASSRLRSLQYIPWLEKADIVIVTQALFDDCKLRDRYRNGGYTRTALLKAYCQRIHALMQRHQYDLLWIEKEALPGLPVWFEKLLLRNIPYALDFDDAIFHNYDQHKSALVRFFYGKRIDQLMAHAVLVTAGNQYLAQRALNAGTRHVEIIPTVIDLERYTPKKKLDSPGTVRIVWIGSPYTVRYLNVIHDALVKITRQFNCKLRIIGGSPVDLPGIDTEFVPWSETTEVESIRECDIGVMPLTTTPWDQGKCGYKLIQYMACGLPVVASPVGVNCEIVHPDKNGYLADGTTEWITALGKLITDRELRKRLGKAGRILVEKEYCVQEVAPKLITLLCQAGKTKK